MNSLIVLRSLEVYWTIIVTCSMPQRLDGKQRYSRHRGRNTSTIFSAGLYVAIRIIFALFMGTERKYHNLLCIIDVIQIELHYI